MELPAGIIIAALLGAVAVNLLVPGWWSLLDDDFLVWCIAGAAGVIGLASVANVLELALDLETS